MSAATLLDEAIRLVTKGWCQGGIAQKATGVIVPAWSPDACRWCLMGALQRARDHGDGVGFADAVNLVGDMIAKQEGKKVPIVEWNDRRGRAHIEVIRLLADALLELAVMEERDVYPV